MAELNCVNIAVIATFADLVIAFPNIQSSTKINLGGYILHVGVAGSGSY
jgi:hypothetical protein